MKTHPDIRSHNPPGGLARLVAAIGMTIGITIGAHAPCHVLAATLPPPPPPPPGIATGARLSAPAFSPQEWKLPEGTTLADTAIAITTEKTNARLQYLPALSGNILVQARLKNVNNNHNVSLRIGGALALGFNSQYRKITLVTLDKGRIQTPALVELPYPDGRIPAETPSDFVLTLALRDGKASAWIDARQIIADIAIPDFVAPPWRIDFTSGWSSNWTLADFAIFAIKPAPVPTS
ncbi:MAG: hypothetical protein LBK99_13980 [Opitutaceae bacterium]|jgi:hypothetical protein|nr:hypothetical protein [Opitutaceae bacterium]